MEKQPRILGLQIYTLNAQGQPHIIASKDENGKRPAGHRRGNKAITDGAVFYGRTKGVDMMILPLRDHNGDPMAAVRLWLKIIPR